MNTTVYRRAALRDVLATCKPSDLPTPQDELIFGLQKTIDAQVWELGQQGMAIMRLKDQVRRLNEALLLIEFSESALISPAERKGDK